ncbi:MAG: hypothetical protein BWX80_03021 [Candidatus Hydrogenedentes bacterium ADurb.Bin101]|nr:MAG: hypothetical protein BWX80_03021 [Candidatus Hydrogenedentes bacterium ADurb.Bin101]
MQLVDEENDTVIRAADFFHDRLEPFLKLAPVLGARHHAGKVQGEYSSVQEQIRHIAAGNRLCQTFHNRGLADAGFADQDGIIFGPPAEYLDDAFNFRLTPDDRVEFVLPGHLSQVAAEGIQCGRL